MASSSSAKKVARVAARSGSGAKANKQAAWLFPAAIAAIVLLGVGIVVFARSKNAGLGGNDEKPRARLSESSAYDHWHAAFAINVCGKEQAPVQDVQEDILGIHTHGDGLAHIHPFSLRASGKRATLGKFFDQVGLVVTDDGFKGADGKVYKAGETTCGGKPTELVVAHWKDATTAASNKPDKIFRSDFASIRFTENYGAYTLALIPKGTTAIAAPSSSAEIETLGAADGGTPGDTSPTPEGTTPTESSDTTTAPEVTSTTAANG